MLVRSNERTRVFSFRYYEGIEVAIAAIDCFGSYRKTSSRIIRRSMAWTGGAMRVPSGMQNVDVKHEVAIAATREKRAIVLWQERI